MSVECQVNVKSQSELDIGGHETCSSLISTLVNLNLNPLQVRGFRRKQGGRVPRRQAEGPRKG